MRAGSQTPPKSSSGAAITVVNGHERDTTRTFSRGLTGVGASPSPRAGQPPAPQPAIGRGKEVHCLSSSLVAPEQWAHQGTGPQRCQHTHLYGQLHLRSHSDPTAFPPPRQALCFDSRLRSSRRRRQAHPPLPLPHRTAPVVKPTPFSSPCSAPSFTPPPPPCPLRAGRAGNRGGRGLAALQPRQAQSPPDKPLNRGLPRGRPWLFLAKTLNLREPSLWLIVAEWKEA